MKSMYSSLYSFDFIRDFPNGWAPLQHMIVEGLIKSGSEQARLLAKEIAVNWIKTNYVAYNQTGNMHEKYTVNKCGDFGGGGEYVPQVTNATLLMSIYDCTSIKETFSWHHILSI